MRRSRHAHLTGSAAVVDPAGERMLCCSTPRWAAGCSRAATPTATRTSPAVALREATEETGIEGLRVVVPAIDLDVHEFVAPGEETHLHLDVRFLVLAPPGADAGGQRRVPRPPVGAPEELAELGVDAGTRRLAHRALDLAFRLPAD